MANSVEKMIASTFMEITVGKQEVLENVLKLPLQVWEANMEKKTLWLRLWKRQKTELMFTIYRYIGSGRCNDN